MEDVRQVLRFENEGIDQITAGINQVADAFDGVEKAKNKALGDLGTKVQEGNSAFTETAGAVDGAAKSLGTWEKLNNSAAKSAGFFKTAMSGVSDAIGQSVNSLSVFGVSIGDARKKIADTRQSLLVYARANSIAGTSAKAAGKASVVGFNLARVGALALRTALGPIGIIIALVAGAFTLLAKAAKRSEPIMNAVSVATAAVGAAVNVLIDRMTAVAEVIFFANKALFQFATGDFDGAMESFGKATDAATVATASLNDELTKEIANAIKLEELQQRIDRTMFNLEIRRAKANADLKALNKITEDVTQTDEARADAAIKFRNIQEGLLSEEIEAREQQIAQILGQTEVTDDLRSKILELGTAGIVFEELGDSANKFSTALSDIGDGRTTFSDEETAKLKDNVVALFNLQTQSDEILTTQANKLNTIRTQQEQRRKKAIEEQRKAEEELAAFRTKIAEQLTQLAIDESEGEARIELERQVAQAQIDELERVAREKFKSAKEAFDLEQEFIQLRESVEKDASDRVKQFRVDEAKAAIEASRDRQLAEAELLTVSGEEELTRAEFIAAEKARIIRDSLLEQRKIAVDEFGEDSAEALAIDVQLRVSEEAGVEVTDGAKKRLRDEALSAIDIRQQIRLAEAELIQASEDADLTAAQFKEKRKTEILIDGLLDRRNILVDQFGENAPEVQLVDLEIEQLQQKIDGLDNINLGPLEKIKQRLQEAFGLDDETTALVVEQAKGMFNNIVSGLESIYERQLIENQRLIDQIDARVEVLDEALQAELGLQEQGLANNADAAQRALDEELQRKEEAEQKRLEIERKAAKQQLLIDAAQQVSSLGLAAVQLLASEASKGLIGLVLAGAGIATIFSIAAKAKAQAAQFAADVPTFRGGGDVIGGLLVGPSHEGGGIFGAYNSPGGQRVINMEGGEFITNRESTAEHRDLLQAVNTRKIRGMSDDQVLQLVGRNPTVGMSERARTYQRVKPQSDAAVIEQMGDKIVQAIAEKYLAVADGKGGFALIDPKGLRKPVKNKL